MKKILISILLSLIIIFSGFATVNNYLTLNFEYSYDTNVFSNPLPQYIPTPDYFTWRKSNPFIKRHSLGFNIAYDLFPQKEGRVGISTSLSMKFPIKAKNYTPTEFDETKGFLNGWEYIETNATNKQVFSTFGSIGPIFRAQLGIVDLGVAIRISTGGYCYDDQEVIIGLQAEPYLNVFVNNIFYISFKFTYDAHLMRFINSELIRFEENYQMLTIAPSIGLGIKL